MSTTNKPTDPLVAGDPDSVGVGPELDLSHEVSCGNVFADLELSDAAKLMEKAKSNLFPTHSEPDPDAADTRP